MLVFAIFFFLSVLNKISGFNLYNNKFSNEIIKKNPTRLFNLEESKDSEFSFVNNQTDSSVKIDEKKFYHFDIFPRLEGPNEHGQLTWYPIGFSKDFGMRPKKLLLEILIMLYGKIKTPIMEYVIVVVIKDHLFC